MESQDWSLQEEFLGLIRQWHIIAALFLVGAAAGWLVGMILPGTYEARARLKVSFNSDAIYLTPDDYKNWQVEELEDLALSEPVLSKTLAELQSEGGSAWSNVSIDDLLRVAAPRWRNAGAWHLTATLQDADRAASLAETWRDVLQAEATEALEHAAAFNRLDRRLNELAREIGRADADIALLALFRTDFEEWDASISDDGAGGVHVARAAVLAERINRYPGLGIVIQNDFPGRDGPADTFQVWGAAVLDAVEDARKSKEEYRAGLLAHYRELEQEWLSEKAASAGLSVYLSVETPANASIQVERHYERGSLAIAGGPTAVLLWLTIQLILVAARRSDEASG